MPTSPSSSASAAAPEHVSGSRGPSGVALALPVPPPKGPAVMLAWIARGARAAPMLTALDQPSPLYGRVHTLLLLHRDAGDPEDRRVFEETRDTLRERLGRACPKIEALPWRTDAGPTDHAAIRRFVEGVLSKTRARWPVEHLYLFLSPGTPAMHAVWLVLGATGFVSDPLTMVQGVPEKDRRPGQGPLERVPVEVDNWLRRFREGRPSQTAGPDRGALWEPARLHPDGAMRAALRQLERVADLPAPVLLLGERGTGKTTLANALRAMSRFQRARPDGGWPSVVCGQFRSNPQLARGELFGYRKGAFTGADRDHEGLLSQADGDSLFLDEIADLDRDTQRLLMAALEGRPFQRLGESAPRTSRFRLICATNRPMEALRKEHLDEDFYDRVSVFVIGVPPLRDCRHDLPLFWEAIWRDVSQRADAHEPALAGHRGLLDALGQHPLPGNLRDLQRIAWHLAAAVIAREDLDQAVKSGLLALQPSPSSSEPDRAARLPLAEPLPELLRAEREAWTEAALRRAGGNQSEAARLLGVKRETFKVWARELSGENSPPHGESLPTPPRAEPAL